ncbi:BGTF surface domain-containing protein [Halorubrum sp. AS12]|uniref:BGTF surface domain-containing protein n=1 Tax=Halorubrum sp. AS12 TaxID=3409687 RepID=UPI003DA702F6
MTSGTFDLVGVEDVVVPTPVTESSNASVNVSVEHPTTNPANITWFATNGSASTSGTFSGVSAGGPTNETIDLSGIAPAGDEITLRVVGAHSTSNEISATESVFQSETSFTVSDDGDVSTTDADVDGSLFWTGQEVEVNLTGTGVVPGDTIDIRSVESRNSGNPSTTGQARSVKVGSGQTIVIDTDRLRGEGFYVLRGPTGSFLQSSGGSFGSLSSSPAEFEVLTQDLTTEFAEDEANNNENVDVDVSSLRSSFDVEVTGTINGNDLDEEELNNIFDDAGSTTVDDETVLITGFEDGDGSFAANFTDVDGGDYAFDFAVDDTNAEDSASINVTELGDGELSLDQNVYTEQQGDVANITVQFEGDSNGGTLVIGDEDDVGYQANVSVDADGEDEVAILFNSYAAGSSGNGSVVRLANPSQTDASISLDDQTNINDILADGDYSLSVSSSSSYSDTLDSPDTLGTLVIEQRTELSQQIWTASDSTVDDIVSAADDDDEDVFEELNGQIEDDNVTQSSTIAEGDQVIHQIGADGLSGLLDKEDTDDSTAALKAALANNTGIGGGLSGDTSLNLRVRQTDDSTTANQDPVELQSNITGNMTVFANETTDNLYVVYDIDDTVAADGDEFDARFRVQDQRLLNPSDSDREELSTNELRNEYYESVTSTFDVAEREFEFDQDPFNVSNAEGQVISGTTNVAPGSEVNVNIRSDSGTSPSFVKTTENVRVSADGEWSAEFDFSDTNVDDEYTVTVRQSGLSENPSVEGTVVEEVETSATFTVSELDPQDVTATVGDTLTVTANVENTGDAESTQTVEFRVGGDAVASQDVTLAPGNNTTVEFADVDTSGLEAGEYEHGVFTDDDSATATLTLEAADDGGDDSSGDDSSGDDSSGDDSSGDDSSGDDSSGDGNGTDDSTDDGTPGFGALVALVALIAAALLATRRNE